MEKRLRQWIMGCALLSFFVPLIVIPSRFIFPFIVPKIVVFRSLALLMLGAYILLLAVSWTRYRIRMTPMNVAILFFLLSFIFSTFIGVDWYRSLWDNHERMLGLFTVFHYILYYFILTSVVRDKKEWIMLLKLFLCAGGIVMVIAILQNISPELLLNRNADRVVSTLGNPIYVGGYGLFLLFIGTLLFVEEQERYGKIYAAAGSFLGLVGVFLSGTRGTLLGLMAAFAAMSVLLFIFAEKGTHIRRGLGGAIVAGLVVCALLFSFRHTAFVSRIPAVGRLLDETSLATGTGNTRILAWGIAFDAWKEKPVFGWGPNNYYYAFNQYYRPEFLLHGYGETWFDNAHNIIMNTLATQGLVGILTYVGLFAVVSISLFSAYRSKRLRLSWFVLSVGFLVGHFIHNVFVFENPTSYLYFFFFLAFLNSMVRVEPSEEKTSRQKHLSLGYAGVVGILVFFLVFTTNINPARANMQTLQTIRVLHTGQDTIHAVEKTFAVPTPHSDDIRNDVGRTVLEVLPEYMKANRKEDATALFTLAFEGYKQNLRVHPYDIRVHIMLAQMAEFGAQMTQDPSLISYARDVLKEALSYSPKRQQIAYMYALILARTGNVEEAVGVLRKTIDEEPRVAEGWQRLGSVYTATKQQDKYNALRDEALAHGITL